MGGVICCLIATFAAHEYPKDSMTDTVFSARSRLLSKTSYSPLDADGIQSAAIDLLRFPMALLVVALHMNPETVSPASIPFEPLSGEWIRNIISIAGSHVLTHVAVPVFFMASGFLFFKGFGEWSWRLYGRKLKSRSRTLLLPYVLWLLAVPLLAILFSALYSLYSGNTPEDILAPLREVDLHYFWDRHSWAILKTDWLGNPVTMTAPKLIPYWFLRDLMVVTLLSPAIYFCIRRAGTLTICLLALCYVSRIWPPIPGMSIAAVFFFSLGAWFSLNGRNITDTVAKYKLPLLTISILTACICVWYDWSHPICDNTYPFFVIAGTLTAFVAAKSLVCRGIRLSRIIVASSFFVYVMHAFPLPVTGSPLSFWKFYFEGHLAGFGAAGATTAYLLAPVLATATCVAAYCIGRKLLPRLTGLMSGAR